ncbi:MAG: acyl transferase [Chitinophagaceae bacterium]|nr:MAG: acyl transferase [Chitinophagaceae bacterium]
MNAAARHIEQQIFNVTPSGFEALAVEVFQFQYEHNETYRQFCQYLHIRPTDVTQLQQIPFLPIRFFKSKQVVTTSFSPEAIFESSGTTGQINSKHLVRFLSLYEDSFQQTFTHFYGDVQQYCIIGLLPSYLQKGNASLVYMVQNMIQQSRHKQSGFYLDDHKQLHDTLMKNETAGIPTILIGVTYALLDFAEKYPMPLQHTIIMETGGMKGRRQELTRQEVHQILQRQFSISEVHSEYGMTELLSQGYSKGNGMYQTAPWLKILLRAADDPFEITEASPGMTTAAAGAINVVDLANLYSCAFLATDDMGKLYPDGSFEVIGRLDNSDIRGCGLMVL